MTKEKIFFASACSVIVACSIGAIVGIWANVPSSGPSEAENIKIVASDIPGAEMVDGVYEPFLWPASDLTLIEQEDRFERSLLKIETRVEGLADRQFTQDLMASLRAITSGDFAALQAELAGFGVVFPADATPDSELHTKQVQRYRRFALRLRFHADEIEVRQDPGQRDARDPQGARPDVNLKADIRHPFIKRVAAEQARKVEVLLPYTYVSKETEGDTYACLGLVMMWNPEVSRWALVEYRSYQDAGQSPIIFPYPTF